MTTVSEKFIYLGELLWKRALGSGMICPDCGESRHDRLDRKFMIAELRRCAACKLIYRAPGDDISQTRSFYQNAYQEGFTTKMPDDRVLHGLMEKRFAGTEKDFSERIAVLKALGFSSGSRVFDFGCSWGYGSWQLMQEGFRVTACEISQPRAEFASRKLGVSVISDLSPDRVSSNDLRGSIDCFFSSHVIEHLPKPSCVFDYARMLLKPGGLFVAFTPNGSVEMRIANPRAWHSIWGKVHPCMIDSEFYKHALGSDVLLDSTSFDIAALKAFASGRPAAKHRLSGDELLCVARF